MPPVPPHAVPPHPVRPKRPRGARPTPAARKAAAKKYRPMKAAPAWMAVIPSVLLDWLNLTDGDCVTAEEAYAKAVASIMAGQPELVITDDTVRTWATANGVLDGADLDQVLQLMTTAGFRQGGQIYGDGPAAMVDYTNPAMLQSALCEGPVKLGVVGDVLEGVVGSTNGWLLTGVPQQQAADEDHCIGLSGFGTIAQLCAALSVAVPSGASPSAPAWLAFTWGTVGIIDQPSLLSMCFEAWLRTPTTVLQSGRPVQPVASSDGSTLETDDWQGTFSSSGAVAWSGAVNLSADTSDLASTLSTLVGNLLAGLKRSKR